MQLRIKVVNRAE